MGAKDREPHLYATDWYEDISEQFRDEVAALKEGEIVEAPGFMLEQALAAYEVGTRKIDSGDPADFTTLEADLARARSAYPLDSDARCKAFLDDLLAAEIAWHYGYSLLQTVFSNVLLENEVRTLDRLDKQGGAPTEAVRGYLATLDLGTLEGLARVACVSVVKSVSVACDIAYGPGVNALYPEEDLYFDPAGNYMLRDFPLQEIIELVDKARKAAKTSGYTPLVSFFELHALWLTVLKQRINKNTKNIEKLMQLVGEYEFTADSELASITSAYHGTACQARFNNSCIRQPLQSLDPTQTRAYWTKILTAMLRFAPVYTIRRSVELTGFYLQFCSREEPAIVRAMAKCFITDSAVLGTSARIWCFNDICEVVARDLPSVPKKAKDGTETAGSEFLTQAALCYLDLLTLFCRNRCRVREGLCALVLSFDSLQVSAQHADNASAPNAAAAAMSFTNWAFMRKLQVMVWIVLMSFENNLVSYAEMGYCAWYAHLLCQQLLSHLGRMRGNFEAAGKGARERSGYAYLVSLEMEMQMLAQLSTAEFMMYIALHKLKPPTAPANASAEMLYRLRFQMFDCIAIPEMPEYASYLEMFEALDVETALRGAANSANSVKNLLSRLGGMAQGADGNDDIPKLKRSAIGLCIAVSKIVKLNGQAFELEVEHTGFHPYFPIPKITPK